MSNGRKKGEPGEQFFSYIEEKKFERKLGRSLEAKVFDKALSWGTFCEKIAFDRIPGLTHTLCSTKTIVHPDITCWAGTPDTSTSDSVGDIKCPWTLKSFCQLADCNNENDLRSIQKSSQKMGEKYFWQLISNAVLDDKQYCELIIYCPYFNDLTAIQDRASIADDEFQWIFRADIETLPYLHKEGEYKDLIIIRFDADPYKDQLIERVKQAQKLLSET